MTQLSKIRLAIEAIVEAQGDGDQVVADAASDALVLVQQDHNDVIDAAITVLENVGSTQAAKLTAITQLEKAILCGVK